MATQETCCVSSEPLHLSHDEARDRLWQKLKDVTGSMPRKEKENVVAVEEETVDMEQQQRPKGHTTHNLFLKDKKSKRMFLVCHRQEIETNLKDLTKQLQLKQLRMCSDRKTALCNEKGCITALSLFNNTQGDVTLVIDEKLLTMSSLCICAGCNDPLDHSQHNVIDITPDQLLTLLKENNQAPEPIKLEF